MSDAAAGAPEVRGLIGWFAQNHVAANLMMFAIIIGGIVAVFLLKKETIPEFETDRIRIDVPYPGASPAEVEKGVVLRIEEAIKSIEGIREMTSWSREGSGTVQVELREDIAVTDMMDEIKLAIDGISAFPAETEQPRISEMKFTNQVINLQIAGDLDEAAMKELADAVREEIVALPDVSSAQVMGSRPFEISIELSESTLRQYGLTLGGVARIVRQWSLDLPGGAIRSAAGDIRLRATGQAYTGQEFARIVLLTRPDGTRIRLGDVATIRDGFAEMQSYSFFDGKRSFGINVMATKDENPIAISAAVRDYVEERNATLPAEAQITAWADTSVFLEGRLNMMLKNMALGALLVLVVLGIFLRIRIALWVILGMAVAFLGGFMLMPLVDVTINLLSLFAFILVLGIVVDDAIIIAESAYTETEKHGYTLAHIVRGAQRVAVPATFGVLTTIMAFAPMLFQTGRTASFAQAIAWVVIFCLAFSLVESKLILPSHLAAMRSAHGARPSLSGWAGDKLRTFIANVYAPLLRRAIAYRWTTLSLFVSIMGLMIALAIGGHLRIVYFPEMESDYVSARVSIQDGAPETLIGSIARQLDASLREVNDDIRAEFGLEHDVVKHLFGYIRDGSTGFFQVALTEGEERGVSPKEVEQRWRAKIGEIAGTQELRFSSSRHMGSGQPVAFRIEGGSPALVESAADELAARLREIDGLREIESSANAGPEEVRLFIKPGAEALGITLAELARQVREAFYGAEAQRIQRRNSEVRVMVRYPLRERKSIGNLENMWIRLPDGREMPFDAVAGYTLERGYSVIRRIDGRRTVTISAGADLARVDPGAVMRTVRRTIIPEIASRHPGVSFGQGASAREQRSSVNEMLYGFGAALIGIYVLMAIPLKSYLQPLAIMTVIPFGLIGAAIGHMVAPNPAGGFGIAMNAISLLGFFALAGVVVNDSLILVHAINRRVAEGASVAEAAVKAAVTRFRPIMLTSLTTFFGLVPIVLERSMHAQMVIPMAVSLSFGMLFATLITLFLIPCLYAMQANLKALVAPKRAHRAAAAEGATG